MSRAGGAGEARRGRGAAWQVAWAVSRRPQLWPVALVQVWRLAPAGWWRRWPPVPAPDPAWVRFRSQTAYGDPDRIPEPADVVAWLEWCRRWRSDAR